MNNFSKKQQIPPPSNIFSVFVSYSSKDTQFVQPIINYIGQINGLWIFFADESLQPGDNINPTIVQNIRNANVFLLFYSESAHKSTYVQQEIGVAIANNKIIIPILLDEIKPSGMLEGVQYLNLSDLQTYQSEAKKLFDFLNRGVQQKIQDDRNLALGILALLGIGVLAILGSDSDYDENR